MINDKQLKEMLVKQKYASAEEVAAAEKKAKAYHTTLVETLINDGLINTELLAQATAELYGVEYVNLANDPPGPEQVKKIPEEIAKRLHIVLSAETKGHITLATDNPEQKDILTQAKKLFPGHKATIAFTPTEQIEAAFTHYRKPLETRFSSIIAAQRKVAPEIIEEIIADAVSFRASDIHFEPQDKMVEVRFRVDGVLREAGYIPKEYYSNVVNRVKVLTHLRIDEHTNPQDGAMHYEKDDHRVDLRVSIVPVLDGEKIVMRLLGSYLRTFNLHDIGLSSTNEAMLMAAANKPFGMILVVGPTGSGKTTTLYALLKLLNSPDLNITTIEDPVEYKMLGVNQIQVNTATELTFARGLRSIVRQDPDIILVGEIRDQETAEIAVNAALTGHLLFSTFHANDAATAVPRLLDMGVEPFLLASTMELIIAQRLVRRICEQCRYSVTLSSAALAKRYPTAAPYFKKKSITMCENKGCEACLHTGYSGQVALFELIVISPEMKTLILTQPSTKQIWDLARQQGSKYLFDDGVEKVESGLTSLDELLRIATPPARS